MVRQAKFRPIAPPKPLFTDRQMLRLRLVRRGIVNEGGKRG